MSDVPETIDSFFFNSGSLADLNKSSERKYDYLSSGPLVFSMTFYDQTLSEKQRFALADETLKREVLELDGSGLVGYERFLSLEESDPAGCFWFGMGRRSHPKVEVRGLPVKRL